MEMPVVEVREYGVWLLAKNVSNPCMFMYHVRDADAYN